MKQLRTPSPGDTKPRTPPRMLWLLCLTIASLTAPAQSHKERPTSPSSLLPFNPSSSLPRPNILFVLTDDQRFDALGYAGNALASTPEMDRLAAEGTYFSHAMASTPICAASRASILSGTYERTHRFNFHTGDVREGYMRHAYPRLLREAGYYTGFYGKYGVRYPHEERLFDAYDTYDRNNAFLDRRGYFYKTLAGDTVHLTRYTGQQGLDFLDRVDASQPFCLQLSFSAPHAHDPAPEQYFWQPGSDALLANATVPPPALGGDEHFEVLPKGVKEGFNRLRWTWRFDTPEKYQRSVKGYFRMLSEVDAEIGRLRAKLAERGLADNTVIVVMGDNGYFLGERQLAGKWLMYDPSVRVPLIVYDPRVGQHHDSDVLANNVDVPATLLDLAGLPLPDTYQGLSLLPVVRGETTAIARDTALVEHLWDFDEIPPSEGIRTADFKYFRYVNDAREEELYDLKKDPQETRNLAKDPKFSRKLTAMRAGLERQIDRYSDDYSAAPHTLTVEDIRDPNLVILIDQTPEVGWVLPKGVKAQVAYQILVDVTEDALATNVGSVYNSGRVSGAQQQNISLGGGPFLSHLTYFWKVRIWDEANRLSVYSKPQPFQVGHGREDVISTPNVFQVDTIRPASFEHRGNGTYLMDFGRAAFGTVHFTYTASKGAPPLTFRLGELRRADTMETYAKSHIRAQTVRLSPKPGTHTYTLSLPVDERNTLPQAVQLPDSFPVVMPFRYVRVEGAVGGLSPKLVSQLAYHSYWEDSTSHFASADTILDQVWDISRYTIKATTFAGLYVDGDRERIPYEADAYLNQLSHYTTDREYAIARQTLEYFMAHPTWPTEWQQHVALMFDADYRYTGNTELIERYYEPLKVKTLMELRGDNGLITSTKSDAAFMRRLGFANPADTMRDIVDWPPAGWGGNPNVRGERDGFVFRPYNTVINALYYRNMVIMADFARVLGKSAEALDFDARAAEARRAFHALLFDPARGVYVDGVGTTHASLHANMFALAFDLVPPEHYPTVVAHIKSRGMACSVYGAQYLLDGLYRAGEADYALSLLRDTSDRSWYNMIRSGATMTMEAWDLKYKPNLDLNHAWGAVPANVIPRGLWGIRPATPGFAVASIHPQLSDLERSEIKVPTIRGAIGARYRKTGGGGVYHVTLPPGMVGEFALDLEDGQALTVDGVPADRTFPTVRLGAGETELVVGVYGY